MGVDHSVIPDGVFADAADGRLAFFELPPPSDADVESIARGIARAVEKTLAYAEPPDDDEEDREHLAVATDAASVGARSGREPSEFGPKRTPRTAVVHSPLGTRPVVSTTGCGERITPDRPSSCFRLTPWFVHLPGPPPHPGRHHRARAHPPHPHLPGPIDRPPVIANFLSVPWSAASIWRRHIGQTDRNLLGFAVHA